MNHYNQEYYTTIYEKNKISDNLYLAKAKIAKEKYFKNIPENSTILDFGCGLGHNTYLFKNSVAYDISEYSLEFCKSKAKNVVRSMDDIVNESMDIVFSSHTLEHVKNPYETLCLFSAKMKKNAKLILILPVEKHSKSDFNLDINQHLFSWNFRSINNLLIKSGFSIINNYYCHGIGFHKLNFLLKISYKLFKFSITASARLLNIKEMVIVAKKTLENND